MLLPTPIQRLKCGNSTNGIALPNAGNLSKGPKNTCKSVKKYGSVITDDRRDDETCYNQNDDGGMKTVLGFRRTSLNDLTLRCS